MPFGISTIGSRFRLLCTRLFRRLGFTDEAFLLVLALIIGILGGAAAVGFHELINAIRDLLYKHVDPAWLYGRGLMLLVILPASGGLAVGVVSRFVFRTREGHGIIDVVESVVRTSGFQRPSTAIEKILTSALTIGSGGSAGAEGPIVQIGAAIASAVGQSFRVARSQMPILIGCGSAAGISAIFNAPFGGVLFTLEVILQDFSIRSFTPVVLASVLAQVTTQGMFQLINRPDEYRAIFAMGHMAVAQHSVLDWMQVGNFVLLGIVCGLIGSSLTRLLTFSETALAKLPGPRWSRPAFGGALLGVTGVIYILLFGHFLMDVPDHKPFPYHDYPMPAFFGDGYGAIQHILSADFYSAASHTTIFLLIFLCGMKMIGTCLTLSSGGSGGVIAPSVFIGATAGGVLGLLFRSLHIFPQIQPEFYALVAMGGVLAAVVHAPLAAILICFELTQDYKVMLPAMLACITATGVARLVYPYSVYTLGLRLRGVRVGASGDMVLLRRLSVEDVSLSPVTFIHPIDPVQRVLELSSLTGQYDFVVTRKDGQYAGILLSEDLSVVLRDREAVPLLLVSEVMRDDIAPVKTTDDLALVFEAFSRQDVSHLPVVTPAATTRVVGLISRSALMRTYQDALKQV